MALPAILPLFPLSNVVLFPHVLLPLHIFEPRYRAMLKDAAAGEDLIGMILLRAEGENLAAPGPDIYGIGCAGRVVRRIELPDGRSNILLQGLREFTVKEQIFDQPYRQSAVEWRAALPSDAALEPELRSRMASRLEEFLPIERQAERRMLADPTMRDEALVNIFSFALDLPFVEKQSLLEAEGLGERATRLVDTLEFHLLEREFARTGALTGQSRPL